MAGYVNKASWVVLCVVLIAVCSAQDEPCKGNDKRCENGGTCMKGQGKPYCLCAPGFTGENCEIADTNDCSPDPCDHGSCTNLENSYTCDCDPGWTGTDCDTDIDDCSPDPCDHGSCNNLENSYTCDCDSGWTGTVCDTDINDCSPDPCDHGSCTNLENSYTCDCDPGWTGTDCDTVVSAGCVSSCDNQPDGDYQSCLGCTVYVTCTNQIMVDDRPCAPEGLVWDDNLKKCEYTSATCP